MRFTGRVAALIAALSFVVSTYALTAREAFADLPISVLDLLKRSTRLDMLDYYDVDSLWVAPNVMEGTARLDTVTDDYLRVRITPVSRLQIKVLEDTKSRKPLVMTIYTVGTENDAPDSDVRFFDEKLRPLRADRYFRMPDIRTFLLRDGAITPKEAGELIPFPTVKLTTGPGTPVLKGRLTLGDHMPRESYDKVLPLIRKDMTWSWTGSKWKLDRK